MESRFPSAGIYVITDAALCAERGLVRCVREALEGGAAAVQYRDKSRDERTKDAARRLDEASALAVLCHEFEVPCIINDDAALAAASGAHGVHVGREDGALADARAQLGTGHVGVSCYGDLNRMRAAIQGGASNVAFGAAFPSSTKPGAKPLSPAVLRAAARESSVPVVAIGGITAANAHEVCATGVRVLAVVAAAFSSSDIRAAIETLDRVVRAAG